METKPQTKGAIEEVKGRLADRWEGRDPFELANRATAQLMDSTSDWSPPPGVEFKRSPVRLGVGIPDAVTLPREELLEALQRAMAAPRDRPLRYHFGLGFEQLREHYERAPSDDMLEVAIAALDACLDYQSVKLELPAS